MTTTTTAPTLTGINIGDEIEITCEGSKPRKVVVTGEYDGRGLFVTSGKVTWGRFDGGMLADRGDGLRYNPTLQQASRAVSAVRVLRTAAQRN